MREILPERVQTGRVRTGPMASDANDGANGKFYVLGPNGAVLTIVANDASDPEALGWEHVSVSTERRCPNWPEMSFVKTLFWSDDEGVTQFHPPISEYVNNHPFCLHLWRNVNEPLRLPPSYFVGMKDHGEMSNGERFKAFMEMRKAAP